MTRKVKNKFIILAVAIFVVCMALCLALSFRKETADAWSFTGGELNAVYYEGDEVNIPDGTFVVDGQTITASSQVLFPDGTTHNTKKVSIEQYGIYKVRYYTSSGLEKFVEFSVDSPLYNIVGNGSAEYGTYTVKNEYWSTRDGVDRYEDIEGVITSLGSGAKLVYNKTVDLRELTASEPLVTVNIISNSRGNPDFGRLNIRVTDIYNPENYLILRIKDKQVEDPDYLSYCYVSINDESTFYRGTTTTAGKYGISNVCSFRGMAGMRGTEVKLEDNTSIKDDVLSYYVSHEKNEVFRTDSRNVYTSVCKLSETTANWKGFTTGEVKIELFAELYYNATADFIVREIAGDKLNAKQIKDAIAPIISVSYDDYSEQTIPLGKKGGQYKVFDANAYDTVEGFLDAEVFVYRNYHSDSKLSVSVEDGVFKTDKTGIYTICYKAKDSYGNESVKLVDVLVVDEQRPIEFNVAERIESAKQGQTIAIAKAEAFGGFGEIDLKTTVLKNGKEIQVANNSFRAMEQGEYKVVYNATDYVGQNEEFSYTVFVDVNDSPVLVESLENILERRYVAGYNYALPEIKMYNFKADGSYTEEIATLTIQNATVSNNQLMPSSDSDTIIFNYSCAGKTYSERRPIYSINKDKDLDLAKVFITGEDIDGSYDSENYAQYLISADSEMEFINKLLADGFSLSFNTDANYNDIKSVNVYITDTENEQQTVKFSFIKDSTKAYFAINDGAPTELPFSFNGNQAKDFSVKLTEASGEVIVSGQVFSINNYLNSNEKYSGFDNHKVYCRVEFEGVGEKGFSFIAKEVNGQFLRSTTKKDMIAPVVVILGDYKRINELGAKFKLPEAIAGDVLSPNLKSFTVTVIAPDGKPVVSNGTQISGVPVDEYEFTLDKFGKYTITYQAIDASGQKNDGGVFAVYVYDLQPPTITLQGSYAIEGEVGKSLTLATAVVTDNYATTSQITVYTMIKKPNGQLVMVSGGSYVPETAGVYTVYFYAMDGGKDSSNNVSQVNMGSASYTITVK